MIGKNQLVKEFELRVFDESYKRIYTCLSQVSEEQLWDSPNGNIPSIGCLVLHLCGNARQWLLSGIGGEEDIRKRDDEFIIHKNIRKSDLVFLLQALKSKINECLEEIHEEQLNKEIEIQGFKVTGFSAIIHVIEHFSYHTGQITTLTKLFKNLDLGYYAGLDLNKTNRMN